jgi:YHYH protein
MSNSAHAHNHDAHDPHHHHGTPFLPDGPQLRCASRPIRGFSTDRQAGPGTRHAHEGQWQGHLHDDDHHNGGSSNPVEVSRRQMLYFLSAGVFGATILGGVAHAKPAKAAPPARPAKPPAPRGPKPPIPAATIPIAKPNATTTKAPSATVPVTTTTAAPAGSTPTTTQGTTSGSASGTVDPWTLYPKTVKATRSSTELIVESTGLPEHLMMIGITNWQQQFPLPQAYTGTNAWRIPLKGVLSDTPISAKTGLFRGAIALAINGVPIFNALNNRGEDSFLIGELDQWGGHCGRGDDYHYHAAPLHLIAGASAATPLAVGLDGFPIYGLTEPDGSPVWALDAFNGHADDKDGYHYHATLTYPYINGGMRGKVSVVQGQVDPQPSAKPIRPAGQPLRGASITAFSQTGPKAWRLQYKLGGATYQVDYAIEGDGYKFVFTDPAGNVRTEAY